MITTLEDIHENYKFKHEWKFEKSIALLNSNYLIDAQDNAIRLFFNCYNYNPFHFRDKVTSYITPELKLLIDPSRLINRSEIKIATYHFHCDSEYLNSARMFAVNIVAGYKEDILIDYSLMVTKVVKNNLLGTGDCIGIP